MAVRSPGLAGPRPRAGALAGLTHAALLPPLAHGPAPTPSGETGYFVICPAPPGPSLLATLRPWPEAELTDFVLKPMALALGELQERGRDPPRHPAGQPVPGGAAHAGDAGVRLGRPAGLPPAELDGAALLGRVPAAWPRGGRIADDVYALGALMVMLALGATRSKACRTTR